MRLGRKLDFEILIASLPGQIAIVTQQADMGDDFGIVLIGQRFDYQRFALFGPGQEKSVQRVG